MDKNLIPTLEDLKKEYIRQYYEKEKDLSKASEEDISTYKKYVKEGVKKNWIIALYAQAYGCYGGNEAFKCDWKKSRDTLLKIIELQGDEDPYVYNTLGYIYYYGRCNDNIPDYDLALKYFSVGAANGVTESVYKISDMFIAGQGVPKSEKSGANLLFDIYDDIRDDFCNEIFDAKLADLAYRVGGLYEQGIGVDQDYKEALLYYSEARYAIRKRMAECRLYGDDKVLKNIEEAYDRVKAILPKDYFKEVQKINQPVLFGYLLTTSRALDIELSKDGNDYYITAKRYASDDTEKNVIINLPEIEYCNLTNTVKVKLKDAIILDYDEFPQKACINAIKFKEGEANTWTFNYRDVELLKVTCTEFIFVPEY